MNTDIEMLEEEETQEEMGWHDQKWLIVQPWAHRYKRLHNTGRKKLGEKSLYVGAAADACVDIVKAASQLYILETIVQSQVPAAPEALRNFRSSRRFKY